MPAMYVANCGASCTGASSVADRCIAFLNDYHIIAYFAPVIPVPAFIITTVIITAAAIITAIVIASAVIVSAIITIAIDSGTVPRSCIGGTSTK
jgi:hypothetical protein